MSITSANAVLTLTQPILFPSPQRIQGFAADDVYDIDQIKSVEAVMGVDGVLSFGFVFVEVMQNITLQADSLSGTFFDIVWTQMQATQDVYPVNGLIILPGISTKFAMINGGLTGYKVAPDAKKTLQPRKFQITWNKIFPQPA